MEEIQLMEPAVEEETAEKLNVTPVKHEELSKEELCALLDSKDVALANYQTTCDSMRESHEKDIKELTEYYTKRIGELNNLIKYYERKFKILEDILTIETGGIK